MLWSWIKGTRVDQEGLPFWKEICPLKWLVGAQMHKHVVRRTLTIWSGISPSGRPV